MNAHLYKLLTLTVSPAFAKAATRRLIAKRHAIAAEAAWLRQRRIAVVRPSHHPAA